MKMSPPTTTDVLVIGAGPMGLLTAIGLCQQDIDTILLDKRERHIQETFGRACTLWPRSLELLELLHVGRDIVQEGFASRSSVNFKDGQRSNERGWASLFDHLKTSYHDYVLNIRQRHSEDVLRHRYQSYGRSLWEGWELTSYVEDSTLNDGFNITATVEHRLQGQARIRSKYIVGSDGASSLVRKLADIPMDTDSTLYEWIRIDAKIVTDMPDADLGIASIESKNHGNVLWIKLDRDAHRIGFALNPKLLEKYPNGITQDQAVEEAIESMKPFKLEVQRLDWWTHYKIRQSVARSLQKDAYILLGGDAAHLHSSGFAQGMNTGIHDATNLAWKLGGVVKGWYKPSVLETYASERRGAAKQLIQIDMDAAALISGDIPKKFQGLGRTADQVLSQFWKDTIDFNLGLGISYSPSVLNQSPLSSMHACGVRCPDTLVRAPGINMPRRFYDTLLEDGATGRWSVVIFAGNPALTQARYAELREPAAKLAGRHKGMLRLVTLLFGSAGGAWAALNGAAVGRFYFDSDGQAHSAFGIDQSSGALVVIRPDHILGFAAGLDDMDKIAGYFDEFVT